MSIKDVKCNEMSDILESLKAKNRIHNSGFDWIMPLNHRAQITHKWAPLQG